MSVRDPPFPLHPPNSISFHYQSLFRAGLDLISNPPSEKQEESSGEKRAIYEVRPSCVSVVIFIIAPLQSPSFPLLRSQYFSFARFSWPLLPFPLILPPRPSFLHVFDLSCGTLPLQRINEGRGKQPEKWK